MAYGKKAKKAPGAFRAGGTGLRGMKGAAQGSGSSSPFRVTFATWSMSMTWSKM